MMTPWEFAKAWYERPESSRSESTLAYLIYNLMKEHAEIIRQNERSACKKRLAEVLDP